jgi:UDP-N-acetylmuramate dehydrogenase
MIIQDHISLKPYHTFGINVVARQMASFSDRETLAEILAAVPGSPRLILGGGSNVLFTKDFDGIVLKNQIKGIDVVAEDEDYVYVRAGAGENWHSFVLYCIERNLGGVENLSLIPGCVGASPMQNIGAYGVEVKDVFQDLEAYHTEDGRTERFSLNDCGFGYRESVFKGKYRNRFVILNVTFRLRRKPVFHTKYGAVEQELERMGVKELSIKAISEAVIHIRSTKLPDPGQIGNAGSFFKNPTVGRAQYLQLHEAFPAMPAYPAEALGSPEPTHGPKGSAARGGAMKLAAGWLIEQCGWKGYRKGDAGCHDRQALVLVNYGNATGKEIYDLSGEILRSVQDRFGVTLEREVNII